MCFVKDSEGMQPEEKNLKVCDLRNKIKMHAA